MILAFTFEVEDSCQKFSWFSNTRIAVDRNSVFLVGTFGNEILFKIYWFNMTKWLYLSVYICGPCPPTFPSFCHL